AGDVVLEPLLAVEASQAGVRDAAAPRREARRALEARALLACGGQVGTGFERAGHELVLGRRWGERQILHRHGERLAGLGAHREREAALGARVLGLGGGLPLRRARPLAPAP